MLLVLLAGAVVGEQWWTRRRIRRYFAERGHEVTRIRWRPLAALLRWRRLSLYRVWYRDRTGNSWSCTFISSYGDDLSSEDERREPDLPAAAQVVDDGRLVPMAADGVQQVDSGPSLWSFVLLCVVCSLVLCLVLGAFYWTAPYSRLQLPWQAWALVVGAGTAGLTAVRPQSWLIAALAMAASLQVVIAVRIVVDLGRDPSSHNLWPLEFAYSLFAATVGCVAGVAGVALIRRLGRR